MMEERAFPYEDIVSLEHPVSRTHGRMSLYDRAAQFSPFAALTGYGSLVEETARLTEFHPGADLDEMERIDRQLRYLSDHIGQTGLLTIHYFVWDETKYGGSRKEITAAVRQVDVLHGLLVLQDGQGIPFEDILSIQGKLFDQIEGEF